MAEPKETLTPKEIADLIEKKMRFLLQARTKVSLAQQVFQHQTDATLSQANPTSGDLYEVLATTRNARIITMAAAVTWTVQPSPLQLWTTIDGVTVECYKNDPVSTTWYPLQYWDMESGKGVLGTAVLPAFILEGRSVKVEAETTGGTVSNLSAKVRYAKIP